MGGKAGHWKRVAVAAAKQCGQPLLPRIGEPAAAKDLLGRAGEWDLVLAAHAGPGARPVGRGLFGGGIRRILLLSGPEGGFTDGEVRNLRQAGAVPVSLGALTLRSETAVLHLLGLVRHFLEFPGE
jgi:16S rRNA (uracil1498-N3)-methyltransferase